MNSLNQNVEGINEKVIVEMCTTARKKTWKAVDDIRKLIQPGMSEKEAIKKANQYLRSQGVKKFWHQTHVRFGQSTILSFNDSYTDNVILKEDDIFYIDIGPIWDNVEGDCGDTFVMGKNPDYLKIASDLKLIFNTVQEHWRQTNISGVELCMYAKNLIHKYGYKMYPSYVKGHRLSEFSHARYTQMGTFDLTSKPASERWIMEMQICHPSMKFGAFFEDLLI